MDQTNTLAMITMNTPQKHVNVFKVKPRNHNVTPNPKTPNPNPNQISTLNSNPTIESTEMQPSTHIKNLKP